MTSRPTRLVVNADDLGLHPSLDAGILRAHREGIVTSATLLAMGPTASEAASRAKTQGLAVGLHLALSTRLAPAAPAESVSTVAPGGRLRGSWADFARDWLLGNVRREEVALELDAQLQRARELGVAVDHLDGHQHLHVLPGIRPLVESLAAREKLPVRWPDALPRVSWLRTPGPALKTTLLTVLARTAPRAPQGVRRVSAGGVFEAGRLDEAALLAALDALPSGDFELGCHPGEGAPHVPEDPAWRYGWQAELAALTSPRVRARLDERGIQLHSYGTLASAT
ncbi:ChbG/HpnK family deacetylase [Myxococcus llanfairpwllgwyngyllgogerychwyrndrobwllllantysiliogogogochensis]|uniref:ChbG/HpnK family deacetylase n=1 Tax=Myxococcus llanfairpwllgwyngyllgogerychwyrndrobwllllantysiliogogogochensis TaxID=2590453 RepID=A0A540X7N2_9BACT|nr:ChbG/HpnK family deacetylase [Myxococcus llanfairpwllgwyngyllgogerychwyrndrobwllllantysiliogogogochensis]TQF17305.1 ChbG/HpnK family deacetylase [Myxococcus llanfairpwllgwyngyllgogerychwyrndrobwllllantysiliogogogochensis]